MQMFGIGILELVVILMLAIIVVGPDRLPAFAADLARWIRRTRAYAQHLTRDFSEVVSELEKEAGASREDWKEIASLVTRHTGDLGREASRLTGEIERSTRIDLEEAKKDAAEVAAPAGNVVPFEPAKPEATETETEAESASSEEASSEAAAWYVPERTPRRRIRD